MSVTSKKHLESHLEIKAEPIAVTVDVAGKMTGLKRSQLYTFIKSGELRCRKVGSRTIILVEDLKAWLRGLPIQND